MSSSVVNATHPLLVFDKDHVVDTQVVNLIKHKFAKNLLLDCVNTHELLHKIMSAKDETRHAFSEFEELL